jgi:hypothetical protein
MARIDLTTLARVKVHLEGGGADPLGGEDQDWDTYLEELIDATSASMERYLGRATKNERRTEYFDVEAGQRVFPLKGFPTVTISTITNDVDRAWTSGDIGSSDYVIDDDAGLLLIDNTYAVIPGNQVLRVIYSGGPGTTTTVLVSAFPDLAHACDVQVSYHFGRRDNLGATGQSFGDQNKSWVGALDWLPTVKATLDRYRRVHLG